MANHEKEIERIVEKCRSYAYDNRLDALKLALSKLDRLGAIKHFEVHSGGVLGLALALKNASRETSIFLIERGGRFSNIPLFD